MRRSRFGREQERPCTTELDARTERAAFLGGGGGGGVGGSGSGRGAQGRAALAAMSLVPSKGEYAMLPSGGGGGGGGGLGGVAEAGLSVIDLGFPVHVEFERGRVDFRRGSEASSGIDLSALALKNKAPLGKQLAGALGCVVTAFTGIGLPYVLSKVTLVQKGEIALVQSYDGSMHVLTEGLHGPHETFGCSVHKRRVTDDLIQFGIISIIRVLPGHVGLGLANGNPVVLLPGMHVLNDALFEYKSTKAMTDLHISLGCLHIITVPTGQVGLCTVNSTAHFLEQGRHHINNPCFRFLGFRNSTDEHIECGSKHRVIIPAGRLGLAWDRGAAVVLEPETFYNVDSATWSYAGSVPITQQVIIHGGLKLVTVRQGFVGISFDDGKLAVLEPGRHVLVKTTHAFSGFLSTGQVTLPISSVTSMSSDNVGLRFDAAITIMVSDAVKAVTMLANLGGSTNEQLDPRSMYTAIVQKAKLALSIIVGNNRLNSSGSGRRARAVVGAQHDAAAAHAASSAAAAAAGGGEGGGGSGADGDPAAADDGGSFKQVLHDSFLASFALGMARDCGVVVIDFSVEDVTFTDPELAIALARGAVARTDLVKAEIDLLVKRTQAQAERQSDIICAEGRAQALLIMAEAEAARIRKLDEAMNSVCAATQQRELVLAAGEVVGKSQSTLILANSLNDVSGMLGANQLARQAALAAATR